ncbi:MAG: carbon-nitrogen hydrolase family protein, partial [Cyclobacteriaceae bacterium]
MTTGIAGMGSINLVSGRTRKKKEINRREVWVAGVSQERLVADSPQQMLDLVLSQMEKSLYYQPDIVCLPEVFATSNIKNPYSLQEKLDFSNEVLNTLSKFASQNHCYVVAPVYTEEGGDVFNSAVLLDREGKGMGEYRKTHITQNEINRGLTPGPIDPPVFDTDFGRVGIQICFDIIWDDGWAGLREKGAELVFWPSAYAGGQTVNGKAWQHKYMVASSTRKGTAKLCDVTGEEITQTGFWTNNLFCGPLNIEKEILDTWPLVQQFGAYEKKYGRDIKITH